MINEILDLFQFEIKKNNIKFIIDKLPFCFGDLILLNQVFFNLIDNAVKYLDKNKEGVIKISGNKSKKEIIYSVEDNGIGIDKKYQKEIFEIFKRLPNSNATGEGLGLTIIDKIINKHKGKIWVESELGKGSIFYISLPIDYNK